MHQPGEPSVEEILQSIKKVMARDGIESAGPSRTVVSLNDPADNPQTSAAEEVLELEPDTMIAFAEDETIAMEQEETRNENPLEGGIGDEAAPDASKKQQGEPGDDGPLTGESTRSAMRDNLAALAMLAQPGAQPRIVRSGETSLEALTRELMRPMLAKWLDENLPAMVEELVKAEIARIAGKRS